MNHIFAARLIAVLTITVAFAEAAPAPAEDVDPVQNEILLIARAHSAAKSDRDSIVDDELSAAAVFKAPLSDSVLLARRAMTLCGWLQNDNDYGRAMKVAARAIKRLAILKEANDADRSERLYWEALLEGRILDHKKRAVELLEEARKLAPEDDRILTLDLEFTAALVEFGR